MLALCVIVRLFPPRNLKPVVYVRDPNQICERIGDKLRNAIFRSHLSHPSVNLVKRPPFGMERTGKRELGWDDV
jgi:hypothetical protein